MNSNEQIQCSTWIWWIYEPEILSCLLNVDENNETRANCFLYSWTIVILANTPDHPGDYGLTTKVFKAADYLN